MPNFFGPYPIRKLTGLAAFAHSGDLMVALLLLPTEKKFMFFKQEKF
jgi:hypothetical protein